MSELKFSIRSVLLCIAWIGITIAAIQSVSIWWASITFSLTLLALATMMLASIFGDENCRAFRVGFLIIGCGYFSVIFAPYLDRHIGHRLITTKLIALVHPWLDEKPPKDAWYGITSSETALSTRNFDLTLRSANGPVSIAAPQWDPFQQTCHSLITIPIAFIGGIFASHLTKLQDAT